MLKKISIVVILIIMMVVFLQIIIKVNNSGVGKYQQFGNNSIINTTTGTVYTPEKNLNEDFIWKKTIYFDKK